MPAPPETSARTADDFASMIEEARERALRVLDEGVERARALSQAAAALAPGAGIDPEAARQIDELRRTLALMSGDMRDVQQRLVRIESLLRAWPRLDSPAPAATPRVEAAPSVPAPAAAPAAYVAPAPPPPPAAASPAASPPPPPPAPPRWAEPPVGLPQSAVPPMRTAQTSQPIVEPLAPAPPPPPAPAFVAPPPAVAPPPSPPAPRPAPAAAQPAPPAAVAARPESLEAPLATFVPEDGSVLVRVAPVAGFQGLMRVQDALARLRGIRQTAVEAYSQGEARLRLEIGEVTDSDEIAGGLAGTLSVPVQVREASEAERSMLIVLG